MHRFLRHSTENCAHIGTHKTGSSPTWGSQKGRKLAEGRKQYWNDDKSEKFLQINLSFNFENNSLLRFVLMCMHNSVVSCFLNFTLSDVKRNLFKIVLWTCLMMTKIIFPFNLIILIRWLKTQNYWSLINV